jgi:sialate O-acetylesterase
MALMAEQRVYGMDDVATSGPVFSGMEIAGGKVVISFSHADGGVVAKGGTAVKGFAVAGEDGRFVWADAQIVGDKVVVQSAEAPNPVAVRYGWADFPDCDLCNKAGLPAAPFRTDGGSVRAEAPTPEAAATPGRRRRHRTE